MQNIRLVENSINKVRQKINRVINDARAQFPLSLPAAPTALDEMDAAAFDAIMQNGLNEAKADHSRPASEVLADLRQGL